MTKEDNRRFLVHFTDEFNKCLDQIQTFFAEQGAFKGLRCLTYGKSRHRMLNYVVFYMVYEYDKVIDVINILPSRSKQKRVK